MNRHFKSLFTGFALCIISLATPEAVRVLNASETSVSQVSTLTEPAPVNAQQAYLKASNTRTGDFFGCSLTLSGNTMVVGAYNESSSATGVNGDQTNSSGTNSGAAYVFVREGTAWSQQAYLKASNTDTGDFFGFSVAVSENTIVIGAPMEASNARGVNGDQDYNRAMGAGAAYVFVRDGTNWTQQAYLKASNTKGMDFFGFSVAVSGDSIVVGAHGERSNACGANGNQDDMSLSYAGAAYVFVREGTNWSQQAYLKASVSRSSSMFGWSVAIQGDTVVVGARGESSASTGVNGDPSTTGAVESGAAYVFVREGTNWSQQAYFKASNTQALDCFGTSAAISDDTIVIGARNESSDATGINGDQSNDRRQFSGAAYVFVRNGTNWSQQAYLKASNTGVMDRFGTSVAAHEDTLVVGAEEEFGNARGVNGNQADNNAYRSGAAYVFVRDGTNWSQQAYLKASNTESNDHFSYSVALWDKTVAVGAPYEDSSAVGVNGEQVVNDAMDSGAVYVLDLNILQFANIVVEQPEGNPLANGSGQVDFGKQLAGGITRQPFLVRNTGYTDLIGLGITTSGPHASEFMVTQAPTEPVPGPYGSTMFTIDFCPTGPGYRAATLRLESNDEDDSPFEIALGGYCLTPLHAAQEAYVKASNTGGAGGPSMGDAFGSSVTIWGDTMVIGAPREDSAATGVNGNQANNSAFGAGAAYVFVRNGTKWSQQAYLKASNTQYDDGFGCSVALCEDTLVVGSSGEDSSANGVNGNQADNNAYRSGAAYVFVRDGTNWSQQAYLKASTSGSSDEFGCAVAVSGNTVVVGAYKEDSNATQVNGDQSNNSAFDSGAAYIFVRQGTNWSQQAYLKAFNAATNDQFGQSVAISGDIVVVGAIGEDSNATGANGDQTDNGAVNSGAAYVFVRHDTNWSQEAYLKASNTGATDKFGATVAVSHATVAIGAPMEDSRATGTDGGQSDNSAANAGAVYVFTRAGSNWVQQAYLKASNTGPGDAFGSSVAVSGDVLAAGSPGEYSSATGINGNQDDNSSAISGAAYAFIRDGTNWLQRAYIKASNTGANDAFGASVGVSGQSVVIGAAGEDSNATGINGNQNSESYSASGAAYVYARFGLGIHMSLKSDGYGGCSVTLNGVAGAAYGLQRAPSLAGPWDTIDSSTLPASGMVMFHDAAAPPGQAFYRTIEP